MIQIWLAILILVIGGVLEWIGLTIIFCSKYPRAGNVVIDIRRTAEDSIYIESPRNLNDWKKYKMLRFDVEIKEDFMTQGTRQ